MAPLSLEILDDGTQIRGPSRLARKEQSGAPKGDKSESKPTGRRRKDSGRDASMGDALRSVYSQAVDEAIPSEFLDLLNKLN